MPPEGSRRVFREPPCRPQPVVHAVCCSPASLLPLEGRRLEGGRARRHPALCPDVTVVQQPCPRLRLAVVRVKGHLLCGPAALCWERRMLPGASPPSVSVACSHGMSGHGRPTWRNSSEPDPASCRRKLSLAWECALYPALHPSTPGMVRFGEGAGACLVCGESPARQSSRAQASRASCCSPGFFPTPLGGLTPGWWGHPLCRCHHRSPFLASARASAPSRSRGLQQVELRLSVQPRPWLFQLVGEGRPLTGVFLEGPGPLPQPRHGHTTSSISSLP